MSLKVPPTTLDIAFDSAKGTLAVANTRSRVMPTLKTVLGARLIGDLGRRLVMPFSPPLTDWRATAPPSEVAAAGRDRAIFAYCASELENTAPIISPIFRSPWVRPLRDGSAGATCRGVALK